MAPVESTPDSSRRSFLIGVAAAAWAVGCTPRAGQEPVGAAAAPAAPEDAAFLKLSQALTGHDDLSPVTAGRLSEAFARIAPDLSGSFGKLATLASTRDTPQARFDAAREAGLGDAAIAVVAAWYTGTAGSGSKAVCVAYADALMYRTTADALAAPTYALGGPAWWTGPAPDVGLARSTAPAPQPSTVGTPTPKRP